MKSRIDTLIAIPYEEVTPGQVKELKTLVQENTKGAANLLGQYYSRGIGGLKKDPLLAKKYYKEGANNNETIAMFNLIFWYKEQMAAKKNYWPKMAKLSLRRFRIFKSRSNNSDRLIELLTQEAKTRKADPSVLAVLGICYLQGLGVSPNTEKALKYLLESAKKIEKDGGELCVEIGELYYFIGKCYQQQGNGPQAFHYFSKAVKKSYIEAHFELAECYLRGNGTGVNKKNASEQYLLLAKSNKPELSPKAFVCLSELAQQEVLNPDIQNDLALCYRYGYTVEIDLVKTNELLENIAQIYQDKINDGSLSQENLVNACEKINNCFSTICKMNVQILERRRYDFQREQGRERQLEEINTVLRCISNINNNGKMESDNEVYKELLQIHSVPETKHLMAYIQARNSIRLLLEKMRAELSNTLVKINTGEWTVKFIGLWWKGTPDNMRQMQSILKEVNNVSGDQLFNMYRKIIKLLTQIKPSSRRHAEADLFYKASLDSLTAITLPPIQTLSVSTKTILPEHEKASKKEQAPEISLLDLSDPVDNSVALMPVASVPEPAVVQSSYQSIYPRLAEDFLQQADEAPPPYPVEYTTPSAPPPPIESEWMHQYRVEEQLSNCRVVKDEPSVVDQSLFTQRKPVPVLKPVAVRKESDDRKESRLILA